MRISELRKLVREVIRESIIDKDGLERAGIALPQTKEKKSKEIGEDKVAGGLAKGLTLNDIAEKHGISIDILVAEFKKGIAVEMEHTTDREIAKEIALDHLFEDPKYYTKLSKIEKPTNEVYTKGQLFKGTIKIGGQPVKVEVELLGADTKKNVFITKVINIDKKYLSKLPSNGILEIPARVFRTPGGGWYKIKTPSVFEAVTTKNYKPVKKGGADDNFTKHHKTSAYAPDYGHPAELDTIDFDDKRKKEPGHQTNTKDTEDRGYEPVKELKKSPSVVKHDNCGCGCGGVTEGGCNNK